MCSQTMSTSRLPLALDCIHTQTDRETYIQMYMDTYVHSRLCNLKDCQTLFIHNIVVCEKCRPQCQVHTRCHPADGHGSVSGSWVELRHVVETNYSTWLCRSLFPPDDVFVSSQPESPSSSWLPASAAVPVLSVVASSRPALSSHELSLLSRVVSSLSCSDSHHRLRQQADLVPRWLHSSLTRFYQFRHLSPQRSEA